MKKFLTMILMSLGMIVSAQASTATMTDIKVSTSQIFDVQWNVSGTTFNASGFTRPFYSAGGSGQLTTAEINAIASANQYFGFFNSTTNPGTYGMAIYNSDGTVARVLHNTGTFRVLSPDVIFYLGNGFWGTVISITEGFNYGSSKSWTNVISNPTSTEISSYVPGATQPLAAGQTASSTPPAPTVVSTAPGADIVVITSIVGATNTTVTTTNAVSEDAVNQTVTTTVTTTNNTPTTTTTCTTPTTVTTYSDNSTTIVNGAQTCTNTVTVATVSSDAVSAVSGRIDQLSQFNNYNYILNSSLGRDLFRRDWIETENGRMYVNVNNNRSTFDNGYTADGRVYGVGIEKDINAVTVIGLRANRATSDLKGTDSINNQKKDHVAVYGTKRTDVIDLHADVNFAKNNYTGLRHVGPYSNSLATSSTDTWITLTGSKEVAPGVTPFAGVTSGKQKIDGYTEAGSLLTARTVGDRSANLNYATIGVNISKDIEKVNFSITASANTDNLQTIKMSVDTFGDEKVKLSLSATETRYRNIRNTSVGIGVNVKF